MLGVLKRTLQFNRLYARKTTVVDVAKKKDVAIKAMSQFMVGSKNGFLPRQV
jgi:hypothetical protein